MRREQNRIRKGNLRACYRAAWFALILVALIAIVAAFTLDAKAENGGIIFGSQDKYQLEQSLYGFKSFTFETELYISPDFADDGRGGIIFGNYNNSLDGNEWGIELHQYGSVRFFVQSKGSIFFALDASDGKNITNNTHENGALSANKNSKADVRTYTKNGKTVKIAVVFFHSEGDAYLFINGSLICKSSETTVSDAKSFFVEKFKGHEFSQSTKNPYHVVGGDHRPGNTVSFDGRIKNLAFYGYGANSQPSSDKVIEHQNAVVFSPDLNDSDLKIAYDMTKVDGRLIKDLSSNQNDAVNQAFSEGGYDFASSSNSFKQQRPLPDLNGFTINTEVYIPSTTADNTISGCIYGNFNDETNESHDRNEWFLDIFNYGVIRLFGYNKTAANNDSYQAYVFVHDGTVSPETCLCTTSVNNASIQKNDGASTDIRTYMGTPSNPKYAKISVSVDCVTGYAYLYINGNLVCTSASNNNTIWKDRTITTSKQNPQMIVGGDCRPGNPRKFKGSIKNISLYSDLLSENEIKEYNTSSDFAPDTADPNLVFAYDLRYASGSGLNDLSKNSNDAVPYVYTELKNRTSVKYINTPTTRPTTTGRGAAITDATAPLIYMYIDDNNDGVAEYNGAYLQFNGNADGTKGGAFSDSSQGAGKKVYLVLQDHFIENTNHFNNMPYNNTDIYIDLNGFSLTAKGPSNSIFSAECKGGASAWRDPQFYIFNSYPERNTENNGCIINDSSSPLIESIVYGTAYVNDYYTNRVNRQNYQCYDYFFEGITFKFGANYTAKNPFVKYSEAKANVYAKKTEGVDGTNTDWDLDGVITKDKVVQPAYDSNCTLPQGMLSGINITFNDCVFDMSATTCVGNTIFNAKDTSTVDTYGASVFDNKSAVGNYTVVNNTVTNMYVNGGEIITGANIAGENLYLAQRHEYNNLDGVPPIRCDVSFGVGRFGNYLKVTVPENTAPLEGTNSPFRASWVASFLNVGDTHAVWHNGILNSDAKRALTLASLKDTGNAYPTEYTFSPSVQYEGRGDYVLARDYYAKNFAVFVNKDNGQWYYLGGANYLFNGDSANDTVYAVSSSRTDLPEQFKNEWAHSLIAHPHKQNFHVAAVLTKDCTVTCDGKYSNFGQIRGRLTYDLGGHTMVWDSGARLVNAEAKIGNTYGIASSDGTVSSKYFNDDPGTGLYHSTRFTMKNGNLICTRATVVVIGAFGTVGGDHGGMQYQDWAVNGKSKLFDLDFVNINFSMSDLKDAIDGFLFKHGDGFANMNNTPVRVDASFTDCVFDVTNAVNVGTSVNISTGKSTTLFNATDDTWNTGTGNINSILNITVNGGEVISKGALNPNFKIADCFNITDDDLPHQNRANKLQGGGVTFGKGSSGEYLKATFTAGSTHPIEVFHKDTGAYLGDLNVSSNAIDSGIGSLHVYTVGKTSAQNTCSTFADHVVDYVKPKDLLTFTKGDKLADGSLVFHLEESRNVKGDVGQNYNTHVPAYYHSAPAEYPFYVLDKYQICVGVYSSWKYAAQKITSFNEGILYLNCDFANGNYDSGNGSFSFVNGDSDGKGGYLTGEFTVDLNGKTFTMGGEAYFMDITVGGDWQSGCDKVVTVKNGTVINNYGRGPICINYTANYAGSEYFTNSQNYPKGYVHYQLTFESVSFTSSKGSPTFWLWENGYDALSGNAAANERGFLKVDATFNNCNITSNHATYPAIPMCIPSSYDAAKSAYERTIFNVTVNGGSITAASGNAFERNVDNNTAEGHVNRTDNIFFVDDTSGNYPTLTIPTAKGQPMHVFLKSDGHYRGELIQGLYKLDAGEVQLSYIKDTVSGDNTVYKMAEPVAINNIRTASKTVIDGKVIANYSTFTGYAPACIIGLESTYPFWVFDGTQMLLATDIYGFDTFDNSALEFANFLSMDNTIDRTVTVYLSADATLDDDARCTNLCYSYRAIAIDLGGHTITVDKISNWQALIYFEQKVSYDQRLVVVHNGSVNLKNDASVVIFNSVAHDGNQYYTDHKVLTPNVVLKDLNIIQNANHSEKAIVARPFAATTATQPRISADLKVINCTVDTSANANATVTLFDTADDYGRIKINPTVDGGSLIGNLDYGMFTVADDYKRVVFTNEQSGAYTTLTIPTSSERPLDVYKTNAGYGIFTKKSVSGDNTVYEITHFQSLDIGIKTNLVFANELLMVIYIPEDGEGNLVKFSVDGQEFKRSGFASLNYRMIGGKKYYAVPVNLPAREAARDIPVIATVGVDGAELNISFTVSLTKYAGSVISASTAPEKAAQKALVLDTLAYVKSAYAYFNSANKAEVSAAIDALLTSGGYDNGKTLTKSEGTTNATGLTSHTLLLDSRPTIRLYVDKATYGDSIFKFKQGETDIPYIAHYDASGKLEYIDIALLAYRMVSEITYEIDTENREAHTVTTVSGSYHINSYYDSATAQGNATLTDIVTKLYLYCQSASAYASKS